MTHHPNIPPGAPPWGMGALGGARFGMAPGPSDERVARVNRIERFPNLR